ncbi:WxL domain-containing protein [Enterococcus sp. 1001283B150225_161107_E12]|uniref:WxL domain-containing protein n=1 Tax=Enterococcus sp. 1001283B150225_161107_E12 TaxID=2787145 RepID=UPI0018A125C1|nr:WxL domain-containing protein [Enterococcus sp. 1001283B150225_161107_E12]
MKKHIALFGTTLLLGSLLGGTGVLAEESASNEATPQSATTEVTGELQLSDNGGFNPNPPSGELNEKTDISNSYFGIAYKPKTFNIGNEVKLADTNEEQNVVMQGQTTSEDNNQTFHIAVKDKNRLTNRGWTLNAKLANPIDEKNLGISIKSATVKNSVKRNINNGTDVFDSKHLIEQVKKDNTNIEVTNPENLEITTENVEVMKALQGKFVNGAYDLELPQVELHIPDASKVKAQSLSTNVTWTLTNAAQ